MKKKEWTYNLSSHWFLLFYFNCRYWRWLGNSSSICYLAQISSSFFRFITQAIYCWCFCASMCAFEQNVWLMQGNKISFLNHYYLIHQFILYLNDKSIRERFLSRKRSKECRANAKIEKFIGTSKRHYARIEQEWQCSLEIFFHSSHKEAKVKITIRILIALHTTCFCVLATKVVVICLYISYY